jgi:hypothetical protein
MRATLSILFMYKKLFNYLSYFKKILCVDFTKPSIHFISISILLVIWGAPLFADELVQARVSKTSLRENIEWFEFYVIPANTDTKRILFVGDSILQEYFEPVCKGLKEISCAKFATSASISSEDFFAQLNVVINSFDFDYIHFNNGLHGFGYSETDYDIGLRRVADLLSRLGARVSFAESTQLDASRGDSFRLNELNTRIHARNKIMHVVAKEYGFPLNPLGQAVNPKTKDYIDPYHHSVEGRRKLEKAVSAFVRSNVKK